jgi:hypothetical protein
MPYGDCDRLCARTESDTSLASRQDCDYRSGETILATGLLPPRRSTRQMPRGQGGNQQANDTLLEETCSPNQLDDAFLQRVFERADSNPMALRHYD